jgi:hypothetical protein
MKTRKYCKEREKCREVMLFSTDAKIPTKFSTSNLKI